MCIQINKIGKQEVGIWWVQKRFPRYGVPIWSLWPNIRFLPSIVAEKNVTKNEPICSMCIKINKVDKQEVEIWWVQKRFPRYGVPIWSLRQHAHRFFHLGVHVPFYLHFWGYIQIFGDAMYPLTLHLGVQRKKKCSPTLRNIYKKQHGARPCMEKMQLIFFVPPNEELEIAPPKIWMYPQKWR